MRTKIEKINRGYFTVERKRKQYDGKIYSNNIVTHPERSFVPNRFNPPRVSPQKTSRETARPALLNGDVIESGSYIENVWYYEGNEEIDDLS